MKKRLFSLAAVLALCLGLTVPALASDAGAPQKPTVVSGGTWFSGAIDENGSLWMWGKNSYGQLGNGTTTDSLTPIKIMDGVAAVSCGSNHALVVKTDGSVWAFGRNSSGELGNNGVGDRTDVYGFVMQTVPTQVSGLTARH